MIGRCLGPFYEDGLRGEAAGGLDRSVAHEGVLVGDGGEILNPDEADVTVHKGGVVPAVERVPVPVSLAVAGRTHEGRDTDRVIADQYKTRGLEDLAGPHAQVAVELAGAVQSLDKRPSVPGTVVAIG